MCAFADERGEHVARLEHDGTLSEIVQPCVRIDGIAADDSRVAWVGGTTKAQGAVLLVGAAARTPTQVPARVAPDTRVHVPARPEAPEPRAFAFVAGGAKLHGVRWVAQGGHDGPGSSPRPLIVSVHPGPTGSSDHSYSPFVDLMCANGFDVASIDYSGSTAHGRGHRQRLNGHYGELDVDECTAAARHLVDVGIADGRALFIRGTSAGGTTALLALCGGVFAGAAAWYPASRFDEDDDEAGFESGYLASLLGPSGSSRSPLARVTSMTGSALIVQGADDEVIDPVDTARLVAAMRAHLGDVTSVEVPGEGHGFRTATGRALALAAELDFYRRLTVTRIAGADRYDAPTSTANEHPGAS